MNRRTFLTGLLGIAGLTAAAGLSTAEAATLVAPDKAVTEPVRRGHGPRGPKWKPNPGRHRGWYIGRRRRPRRGWRF